MRRFLTGRLVIAAVVVALAWYGTGIAGAAFTASTSTSASLAAAATFPKYPNAVTGDGALFQHRMEEAATSSTTTAADSSGHGLNGKFNAAVDGTTTWWTFSEGSGSSTADRSGAANTGTLTAGASWGAGPNSSAGKAVALNGTTGWVDGRSAAVHTSASFSVSAWAYLTSTTGTQVVASQDGTNASAFSLQYDGSTGHWSMAMPNSDAGSPTWLSAQSTQAVSTGRWYLLVGVYDTSTNRIQLYVDGALQATTARSATYIWASSGKVAVGRGLVAGVNARQLNGKVDDVRFTQHAMTATEVTAITPMGTYWPVNEGSGTTLTDAYGNGGTATITGATWSSGALSFASGSSNYAAGPTGLVSTNGNFTVSAWVNLTSSTANHTAISQAGTNSNGFFLRYKVISGSTGQWEFGLPQSDSGPAIDSAPGSSTSVDSGTGATFLTGVYDATAKEATLYVDGVLQSATPHTGIATSGAFEIGRQRWNGAAAEYWNGTIGEVRTYDRALTSDEVFQVYGSATTDWELDEGSGVEAQDSSGHTNRGALVGGAAFTAAGKSGSAVSFDGVDDAITAAAAVSTTGGFAVSAWAYLADKSADRTVLSQAGSTSSGFMLRYEHTSDRWQFVMPRSDSAVPTMDMATSTGSPQVNTWIHLIGVYDPAQSNALKLFVDGVAQTSGTHGTTWSATGSLAAGRAWLAGSATGFWSGKLDGIRVYGRALSDGSARAAYRAASADTLPRLQWNFDENTGTNVADSSGNGHYGTLSTTSAWTSSGHTNAAFVGDGVSTRDATDFYSDRAETPAIRTNASFTVMAWVYLAGTGNTQFVVCQTGVNIFSFMLGYDLTTNKWAFSIPLSDAYDGTSDAPIPPMQDKAVSNLPVVTNTWVHLAGVYDSVGGTLRIYVNGALGGSATHTSAWDGSRKAVVGRGFMARAYWWFDGAIDEVREYQRSMNGAEIAQISGTASLSPAPGAAVAPLLPAVPNGFGAQVSGALQGSQQGLSADTAVAFAGSDNAYNPTSYSSPNPFTVECWIKAASGSGGAIIGFSASMTGMTDVTDRVLYLDSGGRLSFMVDPSPVATVRSSSIYSDGNWHHVAASLGAAGMKLYADGALVASDAAVTSASSLAGYWRFGGANLASVSNRPTSDYLAAVLDEVAVYGTQLSDQQIAWHYHANH